MFAGFTATSYCLPADRICVEGATGVQSTDSEKSEVVLSQGGSIHRINLSGANRRMLHLLKRAKVQLIKIDQQKQMKSAQVKGFSYDDLISTVSLFLYTSSRQD